MLPKDTIEQILKNIQKHKWELWKEYEKLSKNIEKKYWFFYDQWKIFFDHKAQKYQKKFRIPLVRYIIPKNYKHILSIPFIYGMIFPALFLDICLLIYQQSAMRLYWIPRVQRADYIQFDRKHLKYLNLLQKINCIYCSYVNGLFQYAVEIAGRTEKYWCPIKSARRKVGGHNWEEYFAEYGDPEAFRKVFNSNKEFFQVKTHK